MTTNFDESPWGYAKRKEAEQAAKQARAELRDRFAMAALTGLLANSAISSLSYEPIAEETYEWADAMLKARGDE